MFEFAPFRHNSAGELLWWEGGEGGAVPLRMFPLPDTAKQIDERFAHHKKNDSLRFVSALFALF
jgi:hypothetical protein